MAHITVQLVWYRLGELYTNVGVKCERFLEWYEEFSWRRVDILDMLFLGWLVGAFVVVGAIHLYLRFFGLPRCKKSLTNGGPMSPGSPGMRGTVVEPHKTRAESVQWLNSAFSWLYQHYQHTPDFVDSWLRALNEEAKKHAVGEHQVRFDRIHVGSAPPRITHISTDLSASDVLSVYADIEAGSDTTLQISSIQQSATNIRVTACDATITQLKGKLNIQVKIQTDQAHEEIHTSIKFASTPSIKVAIKPRNYDTNIDQPMLESVVRAAICGAVTHVALSSRGGYPNFFATPAFKANGTAGGAIQPMKSQSLTRPRKTPALGTLCLEQRISKVNTQKTSVQDDSEPDNVARAQNNDSSLDALIVCGADMLDQEVLPSQSKDVMKRAPTRQSGVGFDSLEDGMDCEVPQDEISSDEDMIISHVTPNVGAMTSVALTSRANLARQQDPQDLHDTSSVEVTRIRVPL